MLLYTICRGSMLMMCYFVPNKRAWSIGRLSEGLDMLLLFSAYPILTTAGRGAIQLLCLRRSTSFTSHGILWYVLDSKEGSQCIRRSYVVGMIVEVTDTSETTKQRQIRRHVVICDGSERAIVTLWDTHASSFDATGLCHSSASEPIIVLFRWNDCMLAFQSTSTTKWYINIPIPEMVSIKERFNGRPSQIEWQGSAEPEVHPIDSTLAAISEELPNDIMRKRFRLKVHITALVSTDKWWYLACKGCWKKTQPYGEGFKCTNAKCSVVDGGPRYKIVVNGVDVGSENEANQIMGQFTFFGDVGQSITGKEELLLVSNSRGLADRVPPEISSVVGKKYSLVVELSAGSLDEDYNCFYVQACEPISELVLPSVTPIQPISKTTAEDQTILPSHSPALPLPQGTSDSPTDRQQVGSQSTESNSADGSIGQSEKTILPTPPPSGTTEPPCTPTSPTATVEDHTQNTKKRKEVPSVHSKSKKSVSSAGQKSSFAKELFLEKASDS